VLAKNVGKRNWKKSKTWGSGNTPLQANYAKKVPQEKKKDDRPPKPSGAHRMRGKSLVGTNLGQGKKERKRGTFQLKEELRTENSTKKPVK